MATVMARLHVDAEGRVTGRVPAAVPPGDYTAPLEISPAATDPLYGLDDLPVDDEPWDDAISLRREDLYGDEGR